MNKRLLLTLLASVLISPATLSAQEAHGPAATEPPSDDANYALLGEFVGPVEVGENDYQPLGLQVRPIGGDQFEALQYHGGLPGQEKFTAEAISLIGHRSDDFLILSGGPWAIFVEHNHCLLISREGKRLGRLERIERHSPTMGSPPPPGAVVLFDGTNTDQFTAATITEDGLLAEGAEVKPMFQDFNLHVEFRLPYMPESTGQARGNSGCYLQSRYEVQVLDSFAELPTFNGCSSLYRQRAPDLNMCLPPLQWQTYDIMFTAPRWAADGSKIRNARITVWQNGVKTQDDVELPSKTGAGKPEEPNLLPIKFQNHGNPVRFRNIWIVDRGLNTGEFPVLAPAPAVAEEQNAAPEKAVESGDTEASPAAAESAAEKAPAEESPVKESPVKESPAAGEAAAEQAETDVPTEKPAS